jgi:hypothetical protein
VAERAGLAEADAGEVAGAAAEVTVVLASEAHACDGTSGLAQGDVPQRRACRSRLWYLVRRRRPRLWYIRPVWPPAGGGLRLSAGGECGTSPRCGTSCRGRAALPGAGRAGGSVLVVDPVVVAGVIGGAFALGGVVLGGGMNWAASRGAERRAAAGRRGEHFIALVDAVGRLQSEAMILRGPAAPSPESWRSRQLEQVAKVESTDRALIPLLSEVQSLSLRLSMTDDSALKDATDRIRNAATAVVGHIGEDDQAYERHLGELGGAVRQLAQARRAAAAHWWRRRKLRRAISP